LELPGQPSERGQHEAVALVDGRGPAERGGVEAERRTRGVARVAAEARVLRQVDLADEGAGRVVGLRERVRDDGLEARPHPTAEQDEKAAVPAIAVVEELVDGGRRARPAVTVVGAPSGSERRHEGVEIDDAGKPATADRQGIDAEPRRPAELLRPAEREL